MSERQTLITQINQAAAHIDPGLSVGDVERLVMQSHARARRRLVKRLALGTSGIGAAAVLLAYLAVPQSPHPRQQQQQATGAPSNTTANKTNPSTAPSKAPPTVPSAAPSNNAAATAGVTETAAPLRLADGSLVTPLDGATTQVLEESARRVIVDLRRGRSRFDVVPDHARSFEVRAGDVTVLVLGTVFTVERVADRVGVTVERGTVRINWTIGEQELHAGESGWFPPLQIKAESSRTGGRSPAGPSRSAATERKSAEELLQAADAERLVGRPEEGVRLLRRLLREHRHDPRAPLAAFTLGRLLMMELARPREAAAAFAEARTLSPTGPFAEDALAREVEAWSKANDPQAAKNRARSYLRRYPDGRRADTVRAFGRLE